MSGAPRKAVWITLQSHSNVIAVATLLELSAVIITENAQPDQATLDKANDEGVNLLSTPLSSFEVAGRLWNMGLRATPND
jgi:serine kinase of HPr protein (carbohydrate metabolism regulator)